MKITAKYIDSFYLDGIKLAQLIVTSASILLFAFLIKVCSYN